MTGTIRVHFLPAAEGDCILVQAIADAGETTSILIDGGRSGTYAVWKPFLLRALGERRILDLIVVTHIDSDHIGGILALLKDHEWPVEIVQIWFNGHQQVLQAVETTKSRESFSAKQADKLSVLIGAMGLPWNTSFDGGSIHCDAGRTCVNVGVFEIRVLTPTRQKLAAMAGPWELAILESAVEDEKPTPLGREPLGISPLDVEALASTADRIDTAKPNGSSIGLVLSAFGRTIILAGDAHPDDLRTGLEHQRELGLTGKIDLFKVSHHGGSTSTSKALLAALSADQYALLTDSRLRGHPNDEVVAKIVKSASSWKTLLFNYRTDATSRWDDEVLKKANHYETRFPELGEEGYIALALSAAETET